MKKFLGIGLVLILLALALFNKQLTRLFHVVTLFDESRIVQNFSNMQNILDSGERFDAVGSRAWPLGTFELPEKYDWQGEQRSVSTFLDNSSTTSLLVLHQGHLVFEDYRMGTSQEDTRISWSMAKSFLSAMFGIAVDEGKIASLNDAVTDYVPSLAGTAYEGIAIRDVLNMASGVEFDEDYMAFGSDINRMGRVLALGGSMDQFAHSLRDRIRGAGESRQYVSIDTHVLAMVLRAATGQSLHDFFHERLWSKLNPEGPAYYLTDGNGVAFALGGLNMRTRDYARFGELFRLEGQWNGEQLIPRDWVADSTRASAPDPVSKTDPFDYGYQWWVPPDSNGEYYAGGIYGQFIYVSPDTETVIVKTSAHREFRNDGNHGQTVKHETIQMMRAIASHALTAAQINSAR